MDIKFLGINEKPSSAICEVLRELRPTFSDDSFADQIAKQQATGYHLIYVQQGDNILGVAGFYIGEKLAWGKHIYVDDLVCSSSFRSSGVGKFMLDWLHDYAQQHNCSQMHLDSGVQRFAAHKFYLREGFIIASHHFSKSLS